MTRDDIIRMAKEANGYFAELPNVDAWIFEEEKYLERFADLVAAAELRRLHEVNAELIKALAPFAFTGNDYGLDEVVAARAVIRKATGEQQ